VTLIEHLLELRRRLIYCLVTFFVAFGVCYFFASQIFSFLVQPLADLLGQQGGRRRIYTSLAEAFVTYLKVSLFAAFFLLSHDCISGVALCSAGIISAGTNSPSFFAGYTLLIFNGGGPGLLWGLSPGLEIFLSFEVPPPPGGLAIQLEARVSEYLSLVMKLILAFGVCFQLPVLLMLLGHLKVVNSQTLRKNRKFSFLGIVIGAALITPPDIFSPLSLIVPLQGPYEVSILLVKRVEKT